MNDGEEKSLTASESLVSIDVDWSGVSSASQHNPLDYGE